MDLLHQKIKKLGGTFEERTVGSLGDIKNADIVVNCTGKSPPMSAGVSPLY